jgi:hypothetical protein
MAAVKLPEREPQVFELIGKGKTTKGIVLNRSPERSGTTRRAFVAS